MCRSIKTLFNFSPPASKEEMRAAALQFVRKISGYRHPSKVNERAFNRAVSDVARASHRLLHSLESSATPRDRDQVAAAARLRYAKSKVTVN
jgi:hypothetical protein